jgi:RNA polymerase sigma-70 factor (ECF subfamily)
VDNGDTELLAKIRAGDAQALSRLLARYESRVYAFGMRLCREPEDARDVLQETMLTLARSADGFEGRSSLSTWLFTVARSFCIKQRRRRAGAPKHLESLDDTERFDATALPAPDRAPDDSAADRELAAAIDAALDRLEPTLRDVVVLRDIEGLSAPEAAEVLGVSVAATKSRLHRARAQLRALLAPVFGLPPQSETAPDCPDIQRLWSAHQEGDVSPPSAPPWRPTSPPARAARACARRWAAPWPSAAPRRAPSYRPRSSAPSAPPSPPPPASRPLRGCSHARTERRASDVFSGIYGRRAHGWPCNRRAEVPENT